MNIFILFLFFVLLILRFFACNVSFENRLFLLYIYITSLNIQNHNLVVCLFEILKIKIFPSNFYIIECIGHIFLVLQKHWKSTRSFSLKILKNLEMVFTNPWNVISFLWIINDFEVRNLQRNSFHLLVRIFIKGTFFENWDNGIRKDTLSYHKFSS